MPYVSLGVPSLERVRKMVWGLLSMVALMLSLNEMLLAVDSSPVTASASGAPIA